MYILFIFMPFYAFEILCHIIWQILEFYYHALKSYILEF